MTYLCSTSRRAIARSVAVVVAVVLGLVACSPAYNWREVRLGQLVALLPCKPDQAKRVVRLGAQELPLEMLGCETRATLFAVSHVTLESPSQADAVLAHWRTATMATIRSTGFSEVPAQVKGVSGHTLLAHVQASGTRPDGQPVQARLLWFVRGADVYHLAVYGQNIDANEAATFFAEPRLP